MPSTSRFSVWWSRIEWYGLGSARRWVSIHCRRIATEGATIRDPSPLLLGSSRSSSSVISVFPNPGTASSSADWFALSLAATRSNTGFCVS